MGLFLRTLGLMAAAPLAIAAAAAPALGVEVVVQNDSVSDGASAAICPCFVQGEHAAVWLTSPCNGSIVAIQVFWRSVLANQPQVIEDSINIRNAGTYPTPGSIITTLEAPALTDGVLNEYRYFDENQTIPISIPVSVGQVFVVDFVFFNDNVGTSGPSLVRDSGATVGKNAIFAQGLGWRTNQQLGVQGDWFIRAVVDCDPSGACCTNGSCMIAPSEAACVLGGGTFIGLSTDCSVECPAGTGACCFDVSCDEDLTNADCLAMGGTYLGDATNCSGSPCASLAGACCIPATGGCVNLTFDDCVNQVNGTWSGPGTTCPGACTMAQHCPQDIDGDDDVDVFDFAILASFFGQNVTPGTNGDYDNDGSVTVFDFAQFSSAFGCTP